MSRLSNKSYRSIFQADSTTVKWGSIRRKSARSVIIKQAITAELIFQNTNNAGDNWIAVAVPKTKIKAATKFFETMLAALIFKIAEPVCNT